MRDRIINEKLDAILRKRRETDSSFAMLPNKFFSVPYPRNCLFTGRADTLAKIKETLTPDGKPELKSRDSSLKVFVLHGLPGIGKTSLAVEFAHLSKEDFSHVFWIAADSREKLNQGLVGMARSLGLTSNAIGEEPEKVVNTAISWLKYLGSETGKFDPRLELHIFTSDFGKLTYHQSAMCC